MNANADKMPTGNTWYVSAPSRGTVPVGVDGWPISTSWSPCSEWTFPDPWVQ